MSSVRIELSLKTIATILAVVFGLLVVYYASDILIQIFVAFVLMTALHPLVNQLQRLKIPRPVAIAIVYLSLVTIIALTFATLIPPLVDQTARLLASLNLPSSPILDQITHVRLSAAEAWSLLTQYGGSVNRVFQVALSLFTALFTFFTVVVMSVYLLIGRSHLYTYAVFLFRTGDKKERALALIDGIENSVGSWVRGEFTLMLTIGIMTFIGLTLLSIPYALPLAIFAGFMEALPNIGPTLAAVPAVLVAWLTASPIMAGATTLLYIGIQQIENNLIVPYVMKRAAGIQPLTTIILILMGVRFGGIIGALLIIPFYLVIRESLSEFSEEIDHIVHG